jgi:hypothetical protein
MPIQLNPNAKIGPSFPDELRAAGLTGLPFAWGDDGTFTFDPRMTPAQVAAVQAVYVAHDPKLAAPKSQGEFDRDDLDARVAALSVVPTPQELRDAVVALHKVVKGA